MTTVTIPPLGKATIRLRRKGNVVQPKRRYRANPPREGAGILLGKTTTAHAKGASQSIDLYAGTLGSETATGETLTGVYNRFATLATGKWVHVASVNGRWELSAAEC